MFWRRAQLDLGFTQVTAMTDLFLRVAGLLLLVSSSAFGGQDILKLLPVDATGF